MYGYNKVRSPFEFEEFVKVQAPSCVAHSMPKTEFSLIRLCMIATPRSFEVWGTPRLNLNLDPLNFHLQGEVTVTITLLL